MALYGTFLCLIAPFEVEIVLVGSAGNFEADLSAKMLKQSEQKLVSNRKMKTYNSHSLRCDLSIEEDTSHKISNLSSIRKSYMFSTALLLHSQLPSVLLKN